jgi:hypothetical protein
MEVKKLLRLFDCTKVVFVRIRVGTWLTTPEREVEAPPTLPDVVPGTPLPSTANVEDVKDDPEDVKSTVGPVLEEKTGVSVVRSIALMEAEEDALLISGRRRLRRSPAFGITTTTRSSSSVSLSSRISITGCFSMVILILYSSLGCSVRISRGNNLTHAL